MRNPQWPARALLDSDGKRVFACCRKCGRRLAELRGSTTAKLIHVDDKRVGYTGVLTPAGGVHQWVCRCGAKPERCAATLDAAFAAAPRGGKIYLS
jgi:hypothetical protein